MKPSSILFVALLLSAAAPSAPAQTTDRYTCTNIFGWTDSYSISGDGRYLAYATSHQTSSFPYTGTHAVRLHDTTSGTWQVLVTSSFTGTDWSEWSPTVSANGDFVVLTDIEPHLGLDSNALPDVYLYDRFGGIELISANLSGVAGNSSSATPGALSADRRYVLFSSFATDLAPVDTNGLWDVFLRDRTTGITEIVSISTTGVQANADTWYGAVSDDGRYVVFVSSASNLVPGDTEGQHDVFLRDRLLGTTRRLSVDAGGAGGNASSGLGYVNPGIAISADGRFVAFDSAASNLTPNDTNGFTDIFVRDAVADVTRRVNLGPGNVQANGESSSPSISADGRYVGFESSATNLVANDANGAFSDVFVRDRAWSVTEIASISTTGQAGNSISSEARISADGRFLVFGSMATNLGGGCEYADDPDVVRRDRGADPFLPFCAGDGSSTACPCGNDVPAGTMAGCMHSLGTGGVLAGIGNPSIGHDTLVLQGSDMPNSPALYFQGTTAIASVFGDGLRCAGGTVVRIGTTVNAAGVSQFPNGGSPAIHVAGNVTVPGTRTYQVWFRNAATFCTPATFNLTNGLSIAWRP